MINERIEGHIANKLVLIDGQLVPKNNELIQYRLGKYRLPPVPDTNSKVRIEKPKMMPCVGLDCKKKILTTSEHRFCNKCTRKNYFKWEKDESNSLDYQPFNPSM